MTRLLHSSRPGSSVNVSVLACSKGVEAYSIAWRLRSVRPDLEFKIRAIDISPEILEFAKQGVYSRKEQDENSLNLAQDQNQVGRNTWRDQNAPLFERMTEDEVESIFELHGDRAAVVPWLREGIEWMCADASDPAMAALIGPQDIVVANRFLCHMYPQMAENCLRNITRLIKPGGYLFVSGVDLDVRTRVARTMGWKPVADLIPEVHEGDPSLRRGWPTEYWGLEPLNAGRADWQTRYAAAFQIVNSSGVGSE